MNYNFYSTIIWGNVFKKDSLEQIQKLFHMLDFSSKFLYLRKSGSTNALKVLRFFLENFLEKLGKREMEFLIKDLTETWEHLESIKIVLEFIPSQFKLAFLHSSIQFIRLDILKYLIESKLISEIELNTSYRNETEMRNVVPLCAAVASSNLQIVRYLIENTQINVNQTNPESRRTGLHLACENGWFDIVKFLIEKGKADSNVQDIQLETPIWDAIRRNDLKIVQFLVEKGDANLQHQNALKETVLFDVVKQIVDWDILKYLIDKGGFDLEMKNLADETVLFTACRFGRIKILKLFIQILGMDVALLELKRKSKLNQTCQEIAQSRGHQEIVDYLKLLFQNKS